MATTGEPRFPWYETVHGDALEQGDVLSKFEIVLPVASPIGTVEGDFPLEIQEFDVVVMTQTCDIENDNVDSLLLCPWWDLWEFVRRAESGGQNWGAKIRDALRKGNLPGYHLLNDAAQDGLQLPLGIVDFHSVYSAPKLRVRQHAERLGPRLRLLPPYKEHLAQAFARFFMRVGLPIDIPKQKLEKRPGVE